MVVTRLRGGMGNQLFQYAYGRKVSRMFGKQLVLDIYDYEKVGYRKYALDRFNIGGDVILAKTDCYRKGVLRYKNIITRIGNRFMPDYLFEKLKRQGIYYWYQTDFKDMDIEEDEQLFLCGYWQSEDYFKSIKSEIKQLRITDSGLEKNQTLSALLKSRNSVCVHIRRTDYLTSSNRLCTCDAGYYLKGMELLETKVSSPDYFIFSDDLKDVKANFNFGDRNITYIEGQTDYDSFALMTQCRHYIIANSTFSWWASYLSENEMPCIIAPSCWYIDRDIEKCKILRKEFLVI